MNTTSVQNPASHIHRPTSVGGQQVCQDCGSVLIEPILSQEEYAERNQVRVLWDDVVRHLNGGPLDWQLMEMNRLGALVDVPDYVVKVGEGHDDMPPHVRFGETAKWWND